MRALRLLLVIVFSVGLGIGGTIGVQAWQRSAGNKAGSVATPVAAPAETPTTASIPPACQALPAATRARATAPELLQAAALLSDPGMTANDPSLVNRVSDIARQAEEAAVATESICRIVQEPGGLAEDAASPCLYERDFRRVAMQPIELPLGAMSSQADRFREALKTIQSDLLVVATNLSMHCNAEVRTEIEAGQ